MCNCNTRWVCFFFLATVAKTRAHRNRKHIAGLYSSMHGDFERVEPLYYVYNSSACFSVKIWKYEKVLLRIVSIYPYVGLSVWCWRRHGDMWIFVFLVKWVSQVAASSWWPPSSARPKGPRRDWASICQEAVTAPCPHPHTHLPLVQVCPNEKPTSIPKMCRLLSKRKSLKFQLLGQIMFRRRYGFLFLSPFHRTIALEVHNTWSDE